MSNPDVQGKVNGWRFNPAREVWWAKTGPNTWSEVQGTYDDPPRFRP
jgi:hypothetical protein